ncbi:MAG TPA: hypothetical protein VF493_17055 [Terriglobales bacterium]
MYPILYHMAAAESWPSIRKHGLLSTTSLLDLFQVSGQERIALEEHHRPESVTIRHKKIGWAVVRDQKPMSDEGLMRCLQDGLTPRAWYQLLNRRVFFWLTRRRLERMMDARAYKNIRKTVLVFDTRSLLARHEHAVLLSPMNSGATKPMPFPRGRSTFLPLATYPFTERQKLRKEPIVELTVEDGVYNIDKLIIRAEEVGAGKRPRVLVGSGRSQFDR